MFGGGPAGGRDRAASTAAVKALAVAVGRLPNQADSICRTRSLSATRRSFSYFECFAK